LAILQVYGAIASGSLALFTTMADSIFDPLSNLTLILCNRAVNHVDPRRFPSGKARIENAGNISFCFLMISVSLILIVMSIKTLADGNGGLPTTEFHVRLCDEDPLDYQALTNHKRSSHQPSSSPSPSQLNSACSYTVLPFATLTARFAFFGKTTGTISSSTGLVWPLQFSAPKSAGGLIPWALFCCPFSSYACG
jgi:hypothetical protein